MAVYIAMRLSDGVVKIGTSKTPEKRIKQLGKLFKSEMRALRIMEGTFPQEKWMHWRFQGQRVFGEWFTFVDDMMSVEIPDHQIGSSSGIKTARCQVFLTKKEAKEIDAAAQSEGMPVKMFLRFAALKLARSGQ